MQRDRGWGQDLLNWLTRIPDEVGGETDILLGIRYRKYFPKLIFELMSGLGIFESVFPSPCWARGVLGGPHKEFSKIEKNFNKGLGSHVNLSAYLGKSHSGSYEGFYQLRNEMPLLELKLSLTCLILRRFGNTCAIRKIVSVMH